MWAIFWLPSKTNSDVSKALNTGDDSDEGPLLKETAKALRAKNNLTGTTSIKHRLRFHQNHIPSYSSSENSIKGNENSPEDDDGDLTFEETPHVSGDGNPNTSTKHHCSSIIKNLDQWKILLM